MRKISVPFICLVLFAWVIVVVGSGAGWNAFSIRWNFSNTGSFGDSFGPVGAIMAGLAAIAAFEALTEQRAEIKRISAREVEEDRRREAAESLAERQRRLRQAADARALFEQSFFNMLAAHRDIVKETDVGSGDAKKTSRDAFKALAERLRGHLQTTQNLKSSWDYIIKHNKNDLNHYFRFLYHIIRYVDLQESIDRYSYIRLVRAGLSESEIILIAVNCAVGDGSDKFKPLVERYALLHNISNEAKIGWDLEKYFDWSAFEYGEF